MLTPRRERFCREYVKCGVKAEAARRAGYGEKWADREGHRLSRNVEVEKRVEDLEQELKEVAGLTPEKITAGILKETQATHSRDRREAWKLIAQIHGMLRDVREVTTRNAEGSLEPAALLNEIETAVGNKELAHAVARSMGIPVPSDTQVPDSKELS